jgi:putative transposase
VQGLRAISQKTRTTVPGHPPERSPCLVDLNLVIAVSALGDPHHRHPASERLSVPGGARGFISRNLYSYGEGFAYSWKISNSLDTVFCLDALEIALEVARKPQFFNLDQAIQYTSGDFLARL